MVIEYIITVISVSLSVLSFALALIMTIKARRDGRMEVRFKIMKYYGQVLTITLIVSVYAFIIDPGGTNMVNLLAVVVLIIMSWILAMRVW
ncbi:MAG: hypothetical protein DRN53_05130 [Thermoprotei archaeon]|nr:MAG: hypothetical protein DRN53_05130 [Thermoprotei archaeon]